MLGGTGAVNPWYTGFSNEGNVGGISTIFEFGRSKAFPLTATKDGGSGENRELIQLNRPDRKPKLLLETSSKNKGII